MSLSTIKSFHNGIALHLDPNADMSLILEDLAVKFEESRKFFRNAKVALSIEDRQVTAEEEKMIVSVINAHSDLNVLCIIGKNEETDRRYVKALKKVESQRDNNNTRLYVGNVEESDVIESEGSLIVYGNVELGGTVVATKDIIVMGYISGQAYAGTSGDEKSVIICFGLSPRRLQIADYKYTDKGRMSFGKKIKFVPQKLRVTNGKVVSEILDNLSIKDLTKR